MSKLKFAKGKLREATPTEIEILQPPRQKGLAKWRSQIKTTRQLRELFDLDGNFVAYLQDIMDDDEAEACRVNGTIWKARNGKYYGEIISAAIASRYLQTEEPEVEAEESL